MPPALTPMTQAAPVGGVLNPPNPFEIWAVWTLMGMVMFIAPPFAMVFAPGSVVRLDG